MFWNVRSELTWVELSVTSQDPASSVISSDTESCSRESLLVKPAGIAWYSPQLRNSKDALENTLPVLPEMAWNQASF